MVTISEGAFAKVNLTLDVLDKREDGYHNIKSVMQTISLHDDVTVDIGTNAPWQVHCYREVLDETDRENPTTTLVTEGYPQNEENLVWKAAKAYYEATNAEKALKKAVSQDTKDQKAAAKVIAKIEKLPAAEDVIVKNKSAISAARKAYDRLNENAKKYADDSAEVIAKLADCEEALTQAIEDEDAAEAVEKLIKKLPTAKRVKEEHREKVQEALDAYNELTAEQKELVTAKNQQKLFDCCAALDISVDGGDIDLEALELQQEEASRQAAIIEQFVLAEDEDDASLEEDFDESVDE